MKKLFFTMLALLPLTLWAQDNSACGAEFIESVKSVTRVWMIPVLITLCIVFGWAGGYLGGKMLKKHFRRAGVV